MREISVENYLVKRTEAIYGIALKGDVPGRRFLDRILIMPWSATYYVECKRPKNGRYSIHQIETMERLKAMGVKVLTLHTKEAVDDLFKVWASLFDDHIERVRAWHERPRSLNPDGLPTR